VVDQTCACKSIDAYECWALRYNLLWHSHAEIDDDGGPCECMCHECDPDDDEE
jgi:hypothetical protein